MLFFSKKSEANLQLIFQKVILFIKRINQNTMPKKNEIKGFELCYCCIDYSVLMYSDEIQLKETLETQGYQGIDVVVLAIVFSCIGM